MFRRLGCLTIAVLLAAAPGARAQESASSGIVGQILDSTRGALPGAAVTVTNAGTNAQRTAVTDADGRFSIPNLPPAVYRIQVELSGFQSVELKDVRLTNGEIARPAITLGLANVAENVTVTGQSPLLQTANASVSQTITQKQIEDLPVAGRNLLAFAALSAGVTPQAFNRGTQFGAAGSSRSQYVTVEGGRDSSTNYAIDGVYVRSLRFNNLSLNPPLELRPRPRSDRAGAEQRRREQLQEHPAVHRRRRHRRRARRSGRHEQAQPVRALHVLQGQPGEPVALQLHELSADRTQPCRRRHVGDLVVDRQRDALRLQLRLPPQRADQPGLAQLGERHRPEEYGRRYRSDRLRASRLHDDRIHRQRRRWHHARPDREHHERLERYQLGEGTPQPPLRNPGAVSPLRTSH